MKKYQSPRLQVLDLKPVAILCTSTVEIDMKGGDDRIAEIEE